MSSTNGTTPPETEETPQAAASQAPGIEIPEEFVLAKEQLKKIVLFLSRPEVIRGVKATEENALEIVQVIFNELLAEQKRSKVFQAALKATL